MEEGALFLFQLSVDGGRSWSRSVPLTMDIGALKRWNRDSRDNEEDWFTPKSFFVNDVSLVGDYVGDARVNHIWGFKASENLWFNGRRELNFGDIKHHVADDGQNYGKVWYEMRDIGGRSGKNDTVLFNHSLGNDGPGPNVYAVLYDYQIEQNDLEDYVLLLEVGKDIL